MSFVSITFAIFLPIVWGLYWLMPKRYQWLILLISSYFFYMSWNIKYVCLILLTTVVSYVSGRFLAVAQSLKVKRIILFSSILICLFVLFLFKYANFFMDILGDFATILSLELHPITLSFLLPVGISFYTFQTLSYVIDVYYGRVLPEKHFGKYAVFISFFPQLVAGPIERTDNLLPQIKREQVFSYDDTVYGLRQMLWGFYKKIVVADTLSYYVDLVYDDPFSYRGGVLLIVVVFFSIQIYCDFSGYSDIAIGTARLFGIKLMTNFNGPYFSTSVNEFWKKWHVSLSTWFRDYIYIPLGGNRKGNIRKHINTLITFLLSGLWHGANWTFIFWGGIHGCAQVIENILQLHSKKRLRWLSIGSVFMFVTFAWIFFRANTLQEACYVIQSMFEGITSPIVYIRNGLATLGIGRVIYIKIGIMLLTLFAFDWVSLYWDPFKLISKVPQIIRWSIYYLFGVVLIVFCLNNVGESQFVYFQF